MSGNTSGRETLEDILKSHKDIQVITYEYDTFGNRIGETEYKDGLKSESKYIYDSLNHLEEKETNNKKVEGYKYDKDGNLITIEKPGNTKTFTYTIDNKLKDTYVNGSLTESATYDASGLKVTSTLKKEYNVTVTDITVNKEETKGKTRRYTTPYEEDNSYTETHIETIPGSEGYEYTEFVAEHEDEDMQWLADFVGVIAPAFSDSWHQYADSLTTEEYRTVSVEGTESTKKTTEVLHEDSVSGSDTYVKRTPGSVKETQEESSHTETRTYYEKSYLVYDMTLSNPQVLSEESAPGTSRVNYTYAGEERLASSSLGSYVYDGRGSVKKVVNGSAVVRDYDYDPYGNITKGAPAQERMYGYNGEEYTPQTGLIYLRARHYNPSTATFTSEDTYAGDKTNPVTRNRYSYANNNPMMYKDPSGHRAVYLDVNNNPVIVNSKPSKTTVKATKTAAAAVAATVSAAKGVGAAVNKKTTTKTVTNPAKAEVQMATSVGNPSYAPSYSNPAGGNGAQRVVYINGRQYYFGGVNPIAKAINAYMHAPKTGDYTSYAKGEATPAKAVKQRIGWSSHMRSTVVLGEAIGNAIETNSSGIKASVNKALDFVKSGFNWVADKAKGMVNSVNSFVSRHDDGIFKLTTWGSIAAGEIAVGGPACKFAGVFTLSGIVRGVLEAGIDTIRGKNNNPDGFLGEAIDRAGEYAYQYGAVGYVASEVMFGLFEFADDKLSNTSNNAINVSNGKAANGANNASSTTVGSTASYNASEEILQKSTLSGEWKTVNEYMSEFSRKYQEQITGQVGKVWYQNGVKYDGNINGVLVDAKGKYAQFIDSSTGNFYDWFSGKQGLIDEALRQIQAAEGAEIQWYFAEKISMEAVQKVFYGLNITQIELIFEPFRGN